VATSGEAIRGRLPPGLAALAAFAVGLIVLLLLLREAPDRISPAERVEGDVVSSFEAAVREDLGVIDVRPASILRVRAARVAWLDDEGAAWLRAPQATFSVQVAGAIGGRLVIQDGLIESPVVRLVERAPGRWNFAPALPMIDPDRPRTEPAVEVLLRNIRVRNGELAVVRSDETYHARGVQVSLASAVLSGPGVAEPRFHIATARADLTIPETPLGPVTRVVAVEDARLRLPAGSVSFDVARLTFGTSVATRLVGVWDPSLGGLGLEARAVVERLALADLPWLRAEVPEDAVASGTVLIEALPGDRSAVAITGLSVRSETSAASGSIRITVGPADQIALESVDLRLDPLALSLVEAFTGPLPYVGELRGTLRGTAGDVALDLRARLATAPGADPFVVDLAGRMAFTDAGIELRRLVSELHAVPFAALEPLAPGLPFRGPVTGLVRLEGPPGLAPIQLDVRLELGGGIVTVAGTLDLRGPMPAYDLTGQLIGVELQQVLEPAVPPAQIHATFALAGRGASIPDATASLRLEGTFTGWQAQPGDTVAILARVDRGLLVADQARLALGPIDLSAVGEWRFAHGEGGAIRYALAIESLEPLAPYLPRPPGAPMIARGTLAAEGTLAGTLEEPILAGTIRASDFRFADWAASRFDAAYDVRLVPGLPHAVVTVAGRDLRTPGGDFRAATLELEYIDPAFDVHFAAERLVDRGRIEVAAHGQMGEVIREVVITTVELDLDRQRWRLPEPARVDWTAGDVVHLSNLLLVNVDGEGLVRIGGIVAPPDLTDLRVEVAALPVGDLVALVRPRLALEGELWLEGTVRGPAAAPVVDLDARLLGGAIRGVAIEELRGRLEFVGGRAGFTGQGVFADLARIDVEASLPMALVLGLPPTAELVPDLPIQARIHTDDFDLAALGPGIPDVRELEGRVTMDLLVSGTAMDPVLSGVAAIREGALTYRLLNQRFTGIEGEATLEGDLIQVERLVARSDGTALLTGTIRLEDLANPVLDLTTDLDRFRAQGVPGRRNAAFTGRVRIGGTPVAPVLSGHLLVDDGTVDVAQLQATPPLSQDLIGVTAAFDPLGPQDLDLLEPAATRVRITRLDLVAGTALWFQSDEFRINVQGELTVQKPAEDVMITGVLTGERGTFNLRIGPLTRRFDIVSARIQFFGTPGPNPALDITAARVIPGPNRADFELQVRMTGTLATPVLAFATADQTPIAEAEAINFLIFGRDIATLADFPGAGLGAPFQTALDALAFYGAADWISAALAEQFGAGIDYFQVQVRTGTADLAPELAFLLGHEIVDDVFVMVTLPTTDFEARWAAAAEWRIDRQWTLEGGYEPPDLVIGVPGRRLPIALERDQQVFLSLRRRWTF
jgi:hypothetical protein